MQPETQLAWIESLRRFGSRNARRQLPRDGIPVARGTVARVFRTRSLQGLRRGRRAHTTIPELAAHPPDDLVQRHSTATRPNQRWVADLTDVATWRGLVGVASRIGDRGNANAPVLAETINGRYKTEVIHHLGPWKGREGVEYATLEWVA